MKKFKIIFGIAAILCSFAFSTYVLAVSVGGGEWNYGVGWSGNFGFSDYLHGSKQHSASVKRGDVLQRAESAPGVWAQAKLFHFPPTRMEFFWNAW
ncbi:MAG: lactococcin 972 family bacteriocin [Streptococcaceae bacterium]|jgi:lactococcin 972 family bacteriocin|nr:lactococcin 972 family bacteriocin [Streptococcaceae bacterium]